MPSSETPSAENGHVPPHFSVSEKTNMFSQKLERGIPIADNAEQDRWNCEGTLVPPSGYEQETTFGTEGDLEALQHTVDLAQERLRGRLCTEGKSSCDVLKGKIVSWKTGRGKNRVCAMAVISSEDVQIWEDAQKLGPFDASLRVAALELTKGMKKPRVAIDKIVDQGAAGGPRASWIANRMLPAFQDSGVILKEVPESWDGQGMPKGIDVIVAASTSSRQESGLEVIEVQWKAQIKGRSGIEMRVAAPVTFPADSAPATASRAVDLPSSDPTLGVRLMNTHNAGSLCLGEMSELRLHSNETLHVRVYDLYNKSEALQLFPNELHPNDQVMAGTSISLGKFQALPSAGFDMERILVIAAKKSKDLGVFERYKNQCRLPSKIAEKLHRAEGIPRNARASSDGFRLIDVKGCPSAPSGWDRETPAAALASIPECR